MKITLKKIALTGGIFILVLSAGLACRNARRTRIDSILHREAKKMSPSIKLEVADTVLELSRTYDLDPLLILAIMKVESEFDLKARSRVGALGLMQVMPIVVRDVAKEMGLDPQSEKKLATHHDLNIRVGVHYLSNLIRRFKGDLRKALLAYNRGPTSVARAYKDRPAPDSGYSRKVLTVYQQYSSS